MHPQVEKQIAELRKRLAGGSSQYVGVIAGDIVAACKEVPEDRTGDDVVNALLQGSGASNPNVQVVILRRDLERLLGLIPQAVISQPSPPPIVNIPFAAEPLVVTPPFDDGGGIV